MEQETQTRPPWLPRFALIWAGQQFSLVGSALAQFALVWWLTQKTGSATVLATASMVAVLPAVFLGPFVGALLGAGAFFVPAIVRLEDGRVASKAVVTEG
jgi:hypothetical protein